MDIKTIAIATITWARNQQEGALLTSALTALAQLQIPLYITDAGSEPAFVQYLHNLPNSTVLGPEKGVWPQAKMSLQAAAAAGAEWIFYTEPDKLEFFAQHLGRMLQQIVPDKTTGLYLASRSARGFASFPHFQQMTETTINRCCAELIGKQGDYVYGPFLLYRHLLSYLNAIPDTLAWGWRPYTFLMAHRLGYRIGSFEGDFLCPEDQRQDDRTERIYRMKQLAQNMEGLALADGLVLEVQGK